MALWGDLADPNVFKYNDVAVLIYCDSTGLFEPRDVPFSVLMATDASASYCGHRVAIHPAFHMT
jgi:hypothetical protein